MIEKELKILLTKKEYHQIKSLYNWYECITQTNFYYDDSNMSMCKEGISVRVRAMKSLILLQVKVPIEIKGAIHIKKEYEKILTCIPKTIDKDILNKLCGTPNKFNNLNMLGHLITERNLYIENCLEISLDRNIYLKSIDYELEIEYIKEVNLELLNKFNFDIKKESPGKYSRFCNKYTTFFIPNT